MTSIRTFLVVVLISVITLVSFITALHGYRESMDESQLLFEDQLRQQADILIILSEKLPVVGTEEEIYSDVRSANNAYQVFSVNQKLILHSSNAPSKPMANFEPGFSQVNFSKYRWNTYVTQNTMTKQWIMVAEREDVRYQLADTIIMKAVFPVVLSIPITGILVWFIVGFGLKPIQNLAAQLRSKEASDLTSIKLEQVPRELAELAGSTNDLLYRLEQSFARQKRFNSDVAHELRTPVAALKIHLQNLMNDLDIVPNSASKLELGLQRINYVVEQILLLNRMTPDRYMAQFENVDLFDITRNVLETLIDNIDAKKQEITFDGESCQVFGDAFAIETMLKNIILNAVNYTQEGGKVRIEIRVVNHRCTLTVIDNGPGIPEDEYDRVFERFYRRGGDRHLSDAPGCGLGLSIVQYIAELHEAELKLAASCFDSGLSFSVIFPQKMRNRT
ncbi:MAG: HAMP domain-containing histidine kinase [Gammaproteobacteria bacterium]|nr:HAMP domain-containing histidine kinase [Gammaproteobacteria bacterium]